MMEFAKKIAEFNNEIHFTLSFEDEFNLDLAKELIK